jgi:hypothetical protein
MWAFDSQNGQVGASWTGEFLPNTVTEQRWAIGRAPSDGSSAATLARVEMSALPESVGYDSASYRVTFAQPGSLILHQFHFPAWRVLVDGVRIPARAEGMLGLLSVDVGAGEHEVEVSWVATTAVWIGRLLTVVGYVVILWLILTRVARTQLTVPRREGSHVGMRAGLRWLNIAAWVLVGLLLLIGASRVTALAVQPVAVGADFGSVRLEAAEVRPVQAGGEAQARLHWSIQGPVEQLVAFVHIIDGTGAVVAQNDGPLGGDYTPVERWLPGSVMVHSHAIKLPADLPPGRYGLQAGVYRPGGAGAPLLPAGADHAKIDIGVLEVQP